MRRPSLVGRSLFALSTFFLSSVSLSERDRLPNLPGTYYVYRNTQLLYIGMAGKQGLRERWGSNGGRGPHHKLAQLQFMQDRGRRITIKYSRCKPERAEYNEAIAIAFYCWVNAGKLPPLNKKREPIPWDFVLADAVAVTCVLGPSLAALAVYMHQ